jgi:hypothetical protein
MYAAARSEIVEDERQNENDGAEKQARRLSDSTDTATPTTNTSAAKTAPATPRERWMSVRRPATRAVWATNRATQAVNTAPCS